MIVAWFVVNALVLIGLSYANVDGETQQLLVGLSIFISAVSFLVLVASAYLYMAAKLVITATGVQVLRYKTLFWSVQSVVTYVDIQEVTTSNAGLLKGLTGVGTILIQTAAAQPNLALNWIGDVDRWRDFIEQQATAADQAA